MLFYVNKEIKQSKMITLKNISDKQTFHIPRSVMEAEFVSGYETKDVSITSNGTYEIRPSKGKKALSAVSLDVDIQIYSLSTTEISRRLCARKPR